MQVEGPSGYGIGVQQLTSDSDCWQDAAVLAGAVMQLLFWVGLLVHQRTAGRQLRPTDENGLEEPLLGEAGSGSHSLQIRTVRKCSCRKEFVGSPPVLLHSVLLSWLKLHMESCQSGRKASKMSDCAHSTAYKEPADSRIEVVRELAQGVVTQLTFGWVSPLLARGMQRPLQQDDLFQLQPPLMPAACSQRLWVRHPQHMNGRFLQRHCLESNRAGQGAYQISVVLAPAYALSAQHACHQDIFRTARHGFRRHLVSLAVCLDGSTEHFVLDRGTGQTSAGAMMRLSTRGSHLCWPACGQPTAPRTSSSASSSCSQTP